ncbi:MAG TPA: sulfite exporter TauE/SafE family protein [Sphingomicrobium sp.]
MDTFLIFLLVGFAAQIVDGSLGMAYGVVSSTVLISLGVPPATASASVHAAEVFTTAASAGSHALHKNVSWRFFFPLAAAGIVGGVLGAYVLTSIDGDTIKPYVVGYLTIMGALILYRAFRKRTPRHVPRGWAAPLGLVGGFADAVGGGGWGPVVTSNLIVQGASPRMVVGTVNTSELFIALAISGAFLFTIGFSAFGVAALGLLIGGVAAAPLGGYVAKRVPARPMMIMVGIVLTLTSLFGLWSALR